MINRKLIRLIKKVGIHLKNISMDKMMVLFLCVLKVGEQFFQIYFNACINIFSFINSDFPNDWSGLRARDRFGL